MIIICTEFRYFILGENFAGHFDAPERGEVIHPPSSLDHSEIHNWSQCFGSSIYLATLFYVLKIFLIICLKIENILIYVKYFSKHHQDLNLETYRIIVL